MKSGNKMIDTIPRLWDVIDRGVAHLTVNQTATIGGLGSGVSIATAAGSWDLTAVLTWTQTFVGIVVGLLSGGLVVLKWAQQRREMRVWREQNTAEHKASAADRKDLHRLIAELPCRTGKCPLGFSDPAECIYCPLKK